jgi:hypothetical protein
VWKPVDAEEQVAVGIKERSHQGGFADVGN